jgi:hypothetical protein
MYDASFFPEATSDKYKKSGESVTLLWVIRTILPDVEPSQMKYLYDIVLPYYEELGREEERKYVHTYWSKEPMECDCGSIVQRSSMAGHKKTKKHIAFMEAQ